MAEFKVFLFALERTAAVLASPGLLLAALPLNLGPFLGGSAATFLSGSGPSFAVFSLTFDTIEILMADVS